MAGPGTQPNGAADGVVAVGASAGGVEALTSLAAHLPRQLPYAILVTLHMPPAAPSVLARIIDRSGPLLAVTASDRQPLESGCIYVAVPDHHLLIADHRVVLSEGPTENGYRPAINALFRSAALNFGPRAVGVLLSGVLDDGVLGAAAIRSRGGEVVVQHPDDAVFSGMPVSAIEAGVADHQVPAKEIGALIDWLTHREIQEDTMERDLRMELENRIAMGAKFSTSFDSEKLGPHSGYTCPDCNGSLITLSDNNFRCRVGHAWSTEALLQARDDEVENALWVALRSLQEKAKLSRKMAKNVGPGKTARRYTALADEAEHALTILGERLQDTMADAGGQGGG